MRPTETRLNPHLRRDDAAQGPAVRGLSGGGLPPPAVRKRQGPCMGQPIATASATFLGLPLAPQTAAASASRSQDPYMGADAAGCVSSEGFRGEAAQLAAEDASPRVRDLYVGLGRLVTDRSMHPTCSLFIRPFYAVGKCSFVFQDTNYPLSHACLMAQHSPFPWMLPATLGDSSA